MIENQDIPKYVNEEFYEALNAWYYTKLWGLAHGTTLGWANENKSYIDAITTIEAEKNAVENEEQQARMEEAEKKKPKTPTRRGR
jgi:hypothetical protein